MFLTVGNKVNHNSNQKVDMKKIKISEAYLRNCEGFMHEPFLVSRLDKFFKPKKRKSLTLKDLTQLTPHELMAPTDKDGDPEFSKAEVNRIIKYLGWFDLTLADMVMARTVNDLGEVVQHTNLDYELEDGNIAPAEIEAQAEKALQDLEGFEPKH